MSPTPPSSALKQIQQRRSRTLTSIVREEIDGMIASGDLSAGDRVNESELATRLGISRGPVREACRSLEEAGLLVSAVNQGVFVREMTLDGARELYEVRGALSGLIGRLDAERITPAGVQTLQALLASMEQAADRKDLSGYYKPNLEFHELLIKTLLILRQHLLFKSIHQLINQIGLITMQQIYRSQFFLLDIL